MTGNVAQVFVSDDDWHLALRAVDSTTKVGDEALHSTSTLRFREQEEIERDLAAHGFEVIDVRDAPDRPGKELVFVARQVTPGRGLPS